MTGKKEQKLSERPDLSRYARQLVFDQIGREGQEMLTKGRVVVMGCGALGGMIANTLVRAGVGFVRIIDRDFIETDNLQRQILFDEDDIADHLPKAQAAARRLARTNPQVCVEPIVADIVPGNIEGFLDGVDLILDGLDNFETRYLINDAAVKKKLPWIYGGVLGASGMMVSIFPHETPCLRCLFPDPPKRGEVETCDTAGVIAPVVATVGSLQSTEAIKFLIGKRELMYNTLMSVDLWSGRLSRVDVSRARLDDSCPCCGRGGYEYLQGEATGVVAKMCGRGAVQITPPQPTNVAFHELVVRLKHAGVTSATANRFLLRAVIESCEMTMFSDGRTIITGTEDESRARAIYDRYIGS